MKKWFSEHKKPIILSTAATLLPILVGCILWNRLDSTVAIHWDANGVADGFGSKALTVFLPPCIMASLNLLAMLATSADPRSRTQNKKVMGAVFWIIPVISLLTSSFMYSVALGHSVDVTMLILPLMGILFIIIGNYLPKAQQNRSLGIRIYWTLANEENWNRTHRFAGKVWVAGGAAMLLMILLPGKVMLPLMAAAIVLMGLAPLLYSYRLCRIHRALGIAYIPANTRSQRTSVILSAGITAAALVLVSVLLFTGGITYDCSEDALRISATYDGGLSLAYEDMDSIMLRDDFVPGSRVWGFSSLRLSLGTFQNAECGNYTLYAYNACDSMIVIRSGERWLAINAATAEETQALYDELTEKTVK